MSASPAEPLAKSLSVKPTRNFEQFGVLLLIALTAGILIARLASAEPLRSANDRSRWATVWSLSVRGTYIIDEIITYKGWDSIDKVRHEDHFYSTKPPLYPTLLAGLYLGVRQVTGLSLANDTEAVTRIILFLVNVLPFLGAMYCWWLLLLRFGFSPPNRLLQVGLLGLATLLVPYLTVLNNHTPAATSLIFALTAAAYLLPVRRTTDGATDGATDRTEDESSNLNSGWLYAACGFFAAWVCCNELPAALFGLGIFALLARHNWKKTLCWFVPAALVPIIAFVVCTYIATGGWKPFYMYYGTEKYVYEYLGIPSYWKDPKGLDKAIDTVPQYIFHCLVGHHGIFSLTPLLLLCLPGYWLGLRHRTGSLKWLHIMGCLLTVAILAFYWKRTENYNYGGVNVALRWVLWLTPFWLLAIAEWFERCQNLKKVTWLLILLGVPSLYSVWEPWQTPWQHPWLFRVMESRGWIDYSDPTEPLPHPVRGWLNTLPDAPAAIPDYWAEFQNTAGETLRISDGGPSAENQSGRLVIVEAHDSAGNLSRIRRLTVDPAQILAGKSPEHSLLAWEDTREQSTREDQLVFLAGLPSLSAANYSRGAFRYVFTPLRENAFRCRRTAARYVQAEDETGLRLEHRCDLWLSPEIPFGVAEIQYSQSDFKQRRQLAGETWRIVKTGQILLLPESPEPASPVEE